MRCREGYDNVVKQAQVLSFKEEEILWQMGILGTDNPTKLLHSLVFVLGLTCALRAGKEHGVLRSTGFNSQFSYRYDDQGKVYLEYHEVISNNTNKEGLKHKKVFGKIVNIYPAQNYYRCPLMLFDMYTSALPKDRKCRSLYLRPKANYLYSDVWYIDAPVGVNKLQSVVKDICKQAGFEGHFTYHSLRSTSATRMYEQGVDEQVISEVTGHRSLSVRSYKRTSDMQKRKANDCLYNDSKKCILEHVYGDAHYPCFTGREMITFKWMYCKILLLNI